MNAPFNLPGRDEVVGDKVERDKRKPEEQTFFLHYQFDGDGRVRGIAYSSKGESADLRMLLSFTCDVVSRLLQIGWTLAEVANIGPDKFMAKILQRAALAERENRLRMGLA